MTRGTSKRRDVPGRHHQVTSSDFWLDVAANDLLPLPGARPSATAARAGPKTTPAEPIIRAGGGRSSARSNPKGGCGSQGARCPGRLSNVRLSDRGLEK